jgi:D-alanyl-D-alanine carboxypeptidase
LNNAGSEGQPANLPEPIIDDIPEAVRDKPVTESRSLLKPQMLLIGGLGGFVAIAVVTGLFLSRPQAEAPVVSSPDSSATSSPIAGTLTPGAENILGHLVYEEAPASELKPITNDGSLQLRKAAAQQYKRMSTDARRAGVILVPISGFRTVAQQQHLFFDIKAQRGQDTSKRAEVSAPPGYSEHHTGYAIDIGDGRSPATNLSPRFEQTAAFNWLEKNAARYSFELSFPEGNPQGISYEPWHWRFVGDRHSLETFYKAKNLTPEAELENSSTP